MIPLSFDFIKNVTSRCYNRNRPYFKEKIGYLIFNLNPLQVIVLAYLRGSNPYIIALEDCKFDVKYIGVSFCFYTVFIT